MNRFAVHIAILAGLLIFQAWNIYTAKKRRSIFVGRSSYSKIRRGRDFKVAIFLNFLWFLAIVAVTIFVVADFLNHKN